MNAPGSDSRPDVAKPVQYLDNAGPGTKFFDIRSCVTPAQNRLGNAGRNILHEPGIVNLDVSLFRNFRVGEGMQFTLRFESFNFSNTPHFNSPNGSIASSQFGEIDSTAPDQRQLQFERRCGSDRSGDQ